VRARFGARIPAFCRGRLVRGYAHAQADIAKRIDASGKVLDEVMANRDQAVPEGVIKRAQCVGVFPSLVEVAALVSGKRGKGFVSCRVNGGWSAPAPLTLTGGNWGAQFGGEQVDLVMIVMNDKGMRQLESGKFNLGVEASAAAGPVGTHHWTMNSEVVTYARSRGIFAGTNLDGSSIAQDEDDAHSLYGRSLSLPDILCEEQASMAPSRELGRPRKNCPGLRQSIISRRGVRLNSIR
jgi:lipid-binding SYLF domain-containing protein